VTLHRVCILDSACVDYVVHVCGNGSVWCLERVGLVQWYERHKPTVRRVKTNDRITAEGFCFPLKFAASIGREYRITDDERADFYRLPDRRACGLRAESLVVKLIKAGRLRPTFERFIRRATVDEDRRLGVDLFAISDLGDADSGVQVKWDGPAGNTGNLFMQVMTESVREDWTRAPSGRRPVVGKVPSQEQTIEQWLAEYDAAETL